jgi:hypothetical protein
MFTPQQAKTLLDSGIISQETFDKIRASNKTPFSDVAQQTGLDSTLDQISGVAEMQPMTSQAIDPKQQLLEQSTGRAAAKLADVGPSGVSRSPVTDRKVVEAATEINALKSANQRAEEAKKLEEEQLNLDMAAVGLPSQPIQQTPVSPEELELSGAKAPATQPPAPIAPQMNPVLDAPAAIGAQAANDEMSVVKGYETQLAKLEADNAIEKDLKQQQLESDLGKAQEGLDEIAAGKVNPNKVFSDMGFFGKLLMLAGAAAGGYSGQANPTKFIDNIIERDIKAQEGLLASKQAAAKDKVSRYQDLLNKYNGNKEAARNAKRAEMYQMAQLKLTEMAQQSRNVQAQQELQMKAQELGIKAQESVQKAAEAAQIGQGQDPITQKIMKFPAGTQATLLKAKETYDSGKATLNAIKNTFGSTRDIGLSAVVPLSDAKTILATENAKLESAIRQTMAGQGTIQEAEIERNVKPFLLAPTDTASMRRLKEQKLKEFIDIKMAGEAQKLRGFGLLNDEPQLKSLQKN